MGNVVYPILFANVPEAPSGTLGEVFDTTTSTTTSTNPPILPKMAIPYNSGILSFTVTNPYIHYIDNFNVKITPSSYFEISNKLFNVYSLFDRNNAYNNIFTDAKIYEKSDK
jgi:hypothetical protein